VAEPTFGVAPVIVQFTDLTPGSPDGWAWDFQNDGLVDDTAQNPTFEYQHAGIYSVSLRAYLAGELVAYTFAQDLVEVVDGNNVFIQPLEILSAGVSPVPVSYLGFDSLGAISLYFDYDDTKLSYTGIETFVPGEFFSGGIVGDKISVQWFDETGGSDPIIPGVDPDTLFAILFTNELAAGTTQVTFDEAMCALGDKIGNPITDVVWWDENPFGTVIINIGAVVSGRVGYYSLDGPVPGAQLSMGPPNPDVVTDSQGNYSFEPYPYGDYVLHIDKSDDLGGINSLDAIKVVRHSTGQELLNNYYSELAANVNGDAFINALDAIKIVRAAVELEPLTSGDWLFNPASVPINDLNQDRIQNFVSVRMGAAGSCPRRRCIEKPGRSGVVCGVGETRCWHNNGINSGHNDLRRY
jgi:hypothetical protein